MKKLLVGLIVVGLLAVASSAMAFSQPGSSDPLGLIVSGAVLPYFGNTAGTVQSWLEAYAPVENSNLHMFFFNESCVRTGDSVNLDLTANDVEVVRIDAFGNTPVQGLVAIGDTDGTGFNLFTIDPWEAVHLRVLWVEFAANRGRVVEPIAVQTAANWFGDWWWGSGANVGNDYHPMRSGAAFFAPLEAGTLHTTLYLVCPNDNVIGTKASSALSTQRGFPGLFPPAQLAGNATPLRVRVYDDEEKFLRDVTTTCDCLSVKSVTSLSPVYASAVEAPRGTYTEMQGAPRGSSPAVCSTTELVTPTASNPCPLDPSGFQYKLITPEVTAQATFSFTGYRAITVGNLDVFGRLSNGQREALEGNPFNAFSR